MGAIAVKKVVTGVFYVYELLIFARVLMSWAPQPPAGMLRFRLDRITEPVLKPCREILNSLFGFIGIDARSFPMDFSPMLALVIVDVVRRAALIGVTHLVR